MYVIIETYWNFDIMVSFLVEKEYCLKIHISEFHLAEKQLSQYQIAVFKQTYSSQKIAHLKKPNNNPSHKFQLDSTVDIA